MVLHCTCLIFGLLFIITVVLCCCCCCCPCCSSLLTLTVKEGDKINKNILLYKSFSLLTLLICSKHQFWKKKLIKKIKNKLNISWTDQQHFRKKGFCRDTIKQAALSCQYVYLWSVIAASGVASVVLQMFSVFIPSLSLCLLTLVFLSLFSS